MRFSDIAPPKKTAIMVSSGNESKPVHANLVGKNHIATQGPMTQESNRESIPAFYTMAMKNESNTIVNLTNQRDASRSENLQVEYWPAQGETTTYSLSDKNLTVKTTDIEQFEGYDVATLQLVAGHLNANTTDLPREVKIFHFTEWPDHGVPEGDQLKKFNQLTEALENHPHTGKKIIHCRAGVGRTGTLIVLEQLKQGIQSGEITRDSLVESIERLVMEGRKARSPIFVQSEVQLKMLIQFGFDELGKK